MIVSCFSLSYTVSNYHLQISGQRADLELSDVKIVNPYSKASLLFDLRNEGKLPTRIVSLQFSSFLADGTARFTVAPVFNAAPVYNGNPRHYEDNEIELTNFHGWLGACLKYSDILTEEHQQAYVFFFKGLKHGQDVKTGGGGEYPAEIINDKILSNVACKT